MKPDAVVEHPYPYGPTLGAAIRTYWQHRWTLVATTVLGIAAALLFLAQATYTYTATLKVVPAQSNLQESNGNLAGLASLAGLSLAASSAPPFQVYQRAVQERVVADALMGNASIVRRAFAHRWDSRAGRWKTEKGPAGATVDAVKSLIGLPVYPLGPPDGEDLLRFINARSELTVDPRSSMGTLSFEHQDPRFARDILKAIHVEADGYLRRRVLEQTTEHIRYLEGVLRTLTIAEHRSALAQVLSDQEKLLMTARARGAFAADPFGQITVSSRPTSPSPVLALIAGVVFGLLTGAVIVLVRSGLWKAFDGRSG